MIGLVGAISCVIIIIIIIIIIYETALSPRRRATKELLFPFAHYAYFANEYKRP
jgi:O-antigen ligase